MNNWNPQLREDLMNMVLANNARGNGWPPVLCVVAGGPSRAWLGDGFQGENSGLSWYQVKVMAGLKRIQAVSHLGCLRVSTSNPAMRSVDKNLS